MASPVHRFIFAMLLSYCLAQWNALISHYWAEGRDNMLYSPALLNDKNNATDF